MNPFHRFVLNILLLAGIAATPAFTQVQRPVTTAWWTPNAMRDSAVFIRQGTSMRLMMNSNGLLGADAIPWDSLRLLWLPSYLPPFQYAPHYGLEFPLKSGMEHLRSAGLWVGAIANTPTGRRPIVTTSNAQGFVTETRGHFLLSDTFYTASILDQLSPTQRFFDDDYDGRIDEDDLDGLDNDGDWDLLSDDINRNGRPDHGETHVDEDGAAISERDLYVTYRDSFPKPKVPSHYPLDIRVWQKSYSWSRLVKEPILPIEYWIVNKGNQPLDSMYVGLYAKIFLGPYYPVNSLTGRSLERKYSFGFIVPAQTMFASAVLINKDVPPPLGITLLGTSAPLSSLQTTYRFLTPLGATFTDAEKYRLMSSGIIDADTLTRLMRGYPELLLSVGPFLHVQPGDTVKFSVAFVGGTGLAFGNSNVRDNALKALELYNRDYRPENYPPSPPLRLTPLLNGVRLDWNWRPGDPGSDPLETWDEFNKYLVDLPPTHWRKINPPPGKTKGGRVFEAFKLWRSEYPFFKEENLSLIRQFDIDDDLDFEGQTGLQFSFVDTHLVRGRKYWYSVTSMSIPDYYISLDTALGGNIIYDTTRTQPLESALFDNAVNYTPGFLHSSAPGEVKVVPNPYRTDQNYIYENGGYEGLARLWSEFKRSVWFIHLPQKCTIRIYTLMGEKIKVIEHDDNQRIAAGFPTGVEEFPLFSESNRTLASGVYLYLVESEFGKQTGKFVLIR